MPPDWGTYHHYYYYYMHVVSMETVLTNRGSLLTQLTYGSEAWLLNEKTTRMLNDINSRLLHRITGKSIKEEASRNTHTFDRVRWIRTRRAQWLGNILRMDPSRMIHQALKILHTSRAQVIYWWMRRIIHLKKFASNRDACRSLVNAIKGPRVHVVMQTQPTTRTTDPGTWHDRGHSHVPSPNQGQTQLAPSPKEGQRWPNAETETRTWPSSTRHRSHNLL